MSGVGGEKVFENDMDVLGMCKSLAIGEVSIYSEGDGEPVSNALGTHSIPRNCF